MFLYAFPLTGNGILHSSIPKWDYVTLQRRHVTCFLHHFMKHASNQEKRKGRAAFLLRLTYLYRISLVSGRSVQLG